MTALGTIALGSADVAFFSPPPHRPRRPERRTRGRMARTLVRAFRKGLALGLDATDTRRARVSDRQPIHTSPREAGR